MTPAEVAAWPAAIHQPVSTLSDIDQHTVAITVTCACGFTETMRSGRGRVASEIAARRVDVHRTFPANAGWL